MNDYEIGSGLSEQQLKIASWWVRHAFLLHQLGYGSLIAFAAVCWGFTAWVLLDTYAISYPREARIPQLIVNNQLTSEAFSSAAPQPLQITSPSSFSSTDARQDFVVQIANPNPRWWAEFDEHFEQGGTQTPPKTTFILPQSQRLITEIGWKGTTGGVPQFKIDNIRWHRLRPEEVNLDYTAFATSRLPFQFTSTTYSNVLKLDGQTVGQTSFVLNNPSAYGYWNIEITVLLYRLGTPVAVNTIIEHQLKPGESRPISLTWPENLSNITKTDIQANVNILDPQAYLPSEKF